MNITIIQLYASTISAEEKEIGRFSAIVQGKIDHTLKDDVLIIVSDYNTNIGHKAGRNTVGLWVTNEAL